MNGNRRENYSNTGKSAQSSGWGISTFLSVIDNCGSKIKVENILLDNDAPLEEQAKIIAKHINELKENNKCKKINILGISKCGCISVALLKYLDETNLGKLNIMAYSAPYRGTIYASPVSLYNKVDEVINSIPQELLDKIVPFLKKIKPREMEGYRQTELSRTIKNIHWRLFSKSHMDYDISSIDEDGVPRRHKNKYDEKFLTELFDKNTLSMLKKVKFTNITTYCTENTLRQAIMTRNINAIMLYLSDKTIFAGKLSDGMVELTSSRYIEEICEKHNINISKLKVSDGHHDISTDAEIIKKVVDEIIR